MKARLFFAAIFVTAFSLSVTFSDVATASWSVWTEGLLVDKIQPAYNPGTKNTSISIKGAKNEWLAFQVAVRPNGETASNFAPSVVSTFTKGGSTIANSNLVFYIVNYHSLDALAVCYGAVGEWPDACVPYRDRWYNEVRNSSEAGWGQSVSANRTQPFLVEVYIPANAEAGQYSGTIRFTADGSSSGAGGLVQDIIVNLTVWDFSLPSQWSLANAWGSAFGYWEFDNAALGGRDDNKHREYIFRMQQSALDHGVSLYGSSARRSMAATGNTPSFTDTNFTGTWGWKNFLDGTAPQGYNPKPYPIPSFFQTRNDEGIGSWSQPVTYLNNWANWISASGYTKTIFADKFVDEPTDVSSYVTTHNTRHSGYPSRPYEYYTAGGTTYPRLTGFWDDNYRHLWCVNVGYDFYRPFPWGTPNGKSSDFDARKAQYGDILWIYYAGDFDVDCRSSSVRAAGSPMIDAYARQNAFPALLCWKFSASGIHHWTVTQGWGGTSDAVWTNVSSFGAHYNGDGQYYFPGRVSGTTHDIGGSHDIPIESLRLKLFRWGAQVYEYCKLLETQGDPSFAHAQVDKMIRFNQPNTITIQDAASWEAAREAMALAIATSAGVKPATPQGLKVLTK